VNEGSDLTDEKNEGSDLADEKKPSLKVFTNLCCAGEAACRTLEKQAEWLNQR